MKHILFITPFAPSDIGAAMKFTKKTIETLSQSYKIDLVYFKAEGEAFYDVPNKNVRILEVYNVSLKDRLFSVLQKPWLYPVFSVRYRRELKCKLDRYVKENRYDLIFLDHSQSFIYGKAFPDIPKILMSHDVIYQRVSRVSMKAVSAWCHSSEKKILNQPNSHVFTFSTKDKDLLEKQYNLSSFVTCGNIDDSIYSIYPKQIDNTFVFFGQWVRKDNSEGLEWFLKKIYPQIPTGVKIAIIGRGLSHKLHAYIDKLENVEYLGFVDNPYQLIANSKAVLSPLFSGAGVKFKVLESIACGTPVIGSEIAFEGIPKEYADFMINAHSVDEYLEKMSSVTCDIACRTRMKNKFIKEYINPYLIKHIHSIIDK